MRLITLLAIFLLIGCASSEIKMSSHEAKEKLEKKYSSKIGVIGVQELTEDFGPPEWCKDSETGTRVCRFYRKYETKWTGPKTDRKHYDTFDEIVAEFGYDGKLRSYEIRTQR